MTSDACRSQPAPPEADRRPLELIASGDRVDERDWLREREDPQVILLMLEQAFEADG